MIVLGTQSARYSGVIPSFERLTVRVSTDPDRPRALRQREAFVVRSEDVPEGFGWYIFVDCPSRDLEAPTIELSDEALPQGAVPQECLNQQLPPNGALQQPLPDVLAAPA